MTRDELISALERATGPDQSEVIRATLRFALDQGWITSEAYRRAQGMCNSGAFLGAALMLVQEGWKWTCKDGDLGPAASVDGDRWRFAATPAIALCIASLHAKAE